MKARDRLPLLAALWLLTAGGAGWLCAWLLRPEVSVETRTVIREDGVAGGGEEAAGRAGGRAAASSPPVGTDGEAEGGPTPDSPSGKVPAGPPSPTPPPASVLVTVLDANGVPPEGGTVYALGAGEPGADEEERVFHAELEDGGPVHLRLPEAGVYDLGFRSDAWATLVEDVAVAPGDGNAATIRIPPGVPVQVRIEGTWPPPETENAKVLVQFWSDDAVRQVQYPGRGDRGWASGTAALTSPAGVSTPLSPDRAYRVDVEVRETRRLFEAVTEEGRRTLRVLPSLRFVGIADREVVRPGESVSVRIEAKGLLALLPVRDPWLESGRAGSGGRESAVLTLFAAVLREGTLLRIASFPVRIPSGKSPGIPGQALQIDPGVIEVRWYGKGFRAGGKEGIHVGSGEVVEVEVPVQGDPAGVVAHPPGVPSSPSAKGAPEEPSPSRLPVSLEGLPPDRSATLIALDSRDPGAAEGRAGTLDADDGGVAELDGEWRLFGEIAAVSPPFLASPFVPVPVAGPLVVAVEPAGLLLPAPAEVFPEEFGELRLRRIDGRAIPVAEEGGREFSWAGEEVTLEDAPLLGPFLPGPITFEVRLGGLRLPDARAIVRAGRIEVLRIER